MAVTEVITGLGLLGIFGLVYKTTRDNDLKVSRIFGRLDEVKKDNEEKFTRKDMCELQHKQVNDNFDRVKADLLEIKLDIKQILNNGKG